MCTKFRLFSTQRTRCYRLFIRREHGMSKGRDSIGGKLPIMRAHLAVLRSETIIVAINGLTLDLRRRRCLGGTVTGNVHRRIIVVVAFLFRSPHGFAILFRIPHTNTALIIDIDAARRTLVCAGTGPQILVDAHPLPTSQYGHSWSIRSLLERSNHLRNLRMSPTAVDDPWCRPAATTLGGLGVVSLPSQCGAQNGSRLACTSRGFQNYVSPILEGLDKMNCHLPLRLHHNRVGPTNLDTLDEERPMQTKLWNITFHLSP
mmetsp:Transcript_28446/g.63290  ORF Transcript_28446/g.63290 Transcript_28446/m.63290 type:complete len:260 (-) Transcript_28446:823-1602(-)